MRSRSIEASFAGPRVTLSGRLWRRSRSVQVDVFNWGRVADSFRVSTPSILGEAIAPIYKHLPQEGVAVCLRGIEERSLPFGISRSSHEVALCDMMEALSFLEG